MVSWLRTKWKTHTIFAPAGAGGRAVADMPIRFSGRADIISAMHLLDKKVIHMF